MALLEIENLSKNFYTPDGRLSAQINVPALQLEAGESLVLNGVSGSGKTTVLHLISGLLKADSGTIIFDGTNITNMPTAQRDFWRANNISYIFQRLNLLEELTVLENILLPQCWCKGQNKDKVMRKAMDLLLQVGLADKSKCFPFTLSIGEQQRIAVVRALMQQPKLLLADEPTASLDAVNSRIIIGMLQQMCREQQVALLLSTHDETIKDLFPKKYNLRGGCYE